MEGEKKGEQEKEGKEDQEIIMDHLLSANESLIKIAPHIKRGANPSTRKDFIDLLQKARPTRCQMPVASSSKKRGQSVQSGSLLNFFYEGKTQSPATPKPSTHCEQLLVLENNRRSVVGAPKINPSLGKACDSANTRQQFLKTTQYNPSACSKSCPKLLTGTKDQKIEKCETEGNSKRGSLVGLDEGAPLRKGQKLSKELGFIENTEKNFSSKVYNSTPSALYKVGVPPGITIHPGIYSSRQPADKKKPNQPRAVEKKMAKKQSLRKIPWFSKEKSFLRKGKETSHFVKERNEELKQWNNFLNLGLLLSLFLYLFVFEGNVLSSLLIKY